MNDKLSIESMRPKILYDFRYTYKDEFKSINLVPYIHPHFKIIFNQWMSLFHMAWLETQPRSPTSLSLLGHQIWPYGTRQESFPIHDCWTFQTPIFMVDSHSSLVTATPFVKMHHLFWSLEAILQSSSKIVV